MNTIKSAIDLYTNQKEDWQNLMREAMNFDFGWERSVKVYADLYRELEG
jgi:glycogen synthase